MVAILENEFRRRDLSFATSGINLTQVAPQPFE
jgi:hypothetical protein